MPRNTYLKITRFLGSKAFFWLVIAFFVLESLWIAFSFRYPMLYDENFHVPVIQIFSHQVSPFINHQPTSYDHLGSLSANAAGIYHYLMSYPYRLINVFTDSFLVQVIFLRVINIIMAALGLWVFARLFRRVNIKGAYINIGLLAFVLLPIVPFVAATVNYDNMLFPLTALYMLICVRIIQNRHILWYDYVNLIIVGCFATLVKYSFAPIFAASVIYLLIFLWRRYGSKFFPALLVSFKKARKRYIALAVIGLIIFGGMFLGVDIRNELLYGTPRPSCVQTLSKKRCMANYVAARDIRVRATKDQRPVQTLPSYSQTWFNNMLVSTNFSVANTYPSNKLVVKQPLPIMNLLLFFGTFLGVGVLLYAWRSLDKNSSWHFLITITALLFISIYLLNTHSYYKVHAITANQPRYLLSMTPVLLVMILAAVGFMLRKYHWLKLAVLVIVLLMFTQGGGAVTHIVRSNDNWYWQNSKVIKANHAAKKVLQPLVKEHQGKYGF